MVPAELGPKKILIVDDEMDMRIFLRTFFKTNGYEPVLCRNGKEGMASVIKNRPDLIVLDVMMPNDGGALMYKELKSNEQLRSIPVIMLSAVGEAVFFHYLKMLRAHFKTDVPSPDAYIEKPPDVDHLKKVVDAILSGVRMAGVS